MTLDALGLAGKQRKASLCGRRNRVGLPGDPPGGDPTPMEVPAFFNYDMWLGTTPEVPYTLDRVHPLDRITADNQGYSRPGWLRCEQFSAGMITGCASAPKATAVMYLSPAAW